MAKFDLKKAILENKATFFGSLNEGQFSWMTQDTGQQIGSEEENTIPVYMFDDKGKFYYEPNYDGYGEFGGMDYYELLDKMNGGRGDRGRGIDLAFGSEKVASRVLFPALVTKPDMFDYKTHDFTKEAKHDPNQSWYAGEEEEDFIDQNDEEVYGYDDEDEEELEEGYDDQFYAPDHLEQTYGEEMASKIEAEIEDMGPNAWDRFTGMESAEEVEEYISDIKDMITYKIAEEFAQYMSEKEGKTFTVTDGSVEGLSFDLDLGGEKFEGGSYLIKKGNIINVAVEGNPVYAEINQFLEEGKKQYYKDAEEDDAEHIKALEKDMKDDKKSSKMKMSEFKARIKEMVLAEMNLDVTDETSGYDFLAEIEEMLDEDEGLTPLQDYVYQYEIEISGEDKAQDYLDDIKQLVTPQDVYDYYAFSRDWKGSMDSDLDSIFRQVKRKFASSSTADGLTPLQKQAYSYAKERFGFEDAKNSLDQIKTLTTRDEFWDWVKKKIEAENGLEEAKDEEVADEEIEVTDEFSTKEPQGPGGIDVTQNADADLTGDKKSVQDNLEAALEAAKALGDEKLATQIGNSLTFFTKQHVVKEDLNESMFPMLKRILK
jgi:hypothetical protein